MKKNKTTEPINHYGYIDPKFTFDNFVVASSNESCVLASKSVVEQPGGDCNPLYIYGGKGLGKSHLIHAIANEFIAMGKLKIRILSAEQLLNKFIASVRDDTKQSFRHLYRNVDLLIVDDVQFIAEKENIQEELLCIFDTLYDLKKQIVLASECPTCAMPGLDKIFSRFQSGCTAEIKIPSLDTRLIILAKKAEVEGISLDDDVAHLFASHFTTNIRELEGAWVRLFVHAHLTNKTINLNLANHVLRDVFQEKH